MNLIEKNHFQTKFVNTDKGIQLLTQQEWRKYRNLHRETKFHARFKICNYQPAMNDRCQAALTNETIEAHLAEQNAKRKGSHHSDHKPLPDIIPKRPKREESESPVPRKKSTENDARKTSFDGDVSRSDTGPSDQEPGIYMYQHVHLSYGLISCNVSFCGPFLSDVNITYVYLPCN